MQGLPRKNVWMGAHVALKLVYVYFITDVAFPDVQDHSCSAALLLAYRYFSRFSELRLWEFILYIVDNEVFKVFATH